MRIFKKRFPAPTANRTVSLCEAVALPQKPRQRDAVGRGPNREAKGAEGASETALGSFILPTTRGGVLVTLAPRPPLVFTDGDLGPRRG